jgi:hypothetical protein
MAGGESGEGSGGQQDPTGVMVVSAPGRRGRRLEVGGQYDHRRDREVTRSILALGLLLLLAIVSALLVVAVAAKWFTIDDAKDLALAILTPLIALTGAAIGFYFGGKDE